MGSDDSIPSHNIGELVLDLGESTPPLVMVRRWAAVALADLSDDVLGDVLLVVTELVTNAFDHGVFAREVRLFRIPGPCAVRIEVDDSSPAQPVIGHSKINRHRSRGLVIVDRLSKAWGAIPNVVGKTDRGGEYTANLTAQACSRHGLRRSMGATRICWDKRVRRSPPRPT